MFVDFVNKTYASYNIGNVNDSQRKKKLADHKNMI